MDSQELSRRLLEIAKGSPGITITERACWLDGEECPYGKPEGQLLKRPKSFCKPKGKELTGCPKLNDNLGEIDELTSVSVYQELSGEIEEEIKKATTRVSSELRALADGAESDQVKGTLKLAAELIEKEEFGLPYLLTGRFKN